MTDRRSALGLSALALMCACPAVVRGNPILDPSAPNSLVLYSLGTVPDVASHYGGQYSYEGLAFNGNTLLMSVGNAATQTQIVWSLPLVRSDNHIVGFGNAAIYAQILGYPTNQYGNIVAGGLMVTPNGVLYTTSANSYVGQYKTNTGTSTFVDLSGTGATTGGLNDVPNTFFANSAGAMKASSTNGTWYTLNLGGSFGAYTLSSYTAYNAGVGAFSFDFLPADATFSSPSVVLGDSSSLRLDVYQLDTNGNPCVPGVGIGCAPVIHLVDGDNFIGLGVVRDPVTGDVLFTTGDNQIWLVSDTIPEPSTVVLALAGIGVVWVRRRVAGRG